MDVLTRYLKAHTAAFLALVGWLVWALHDGQISGAEWLGLPGALGIGGAVAAVPNKPRRRTAAGYALIELLLAIILIIIVIALIVWLIPNHHR